MTYRCLLSICLCLLVGVTVSVPFEDLYTENTNVAIRWARLHFEIMRNPAFHHTPPMAARSIAIVQNAIYDTWAYFDQKASTTIHYDIVLSCASKKRRTKRDLEKAISVAAWRTIQHMYKDMEMKNIVIEQTDLLLKELTGLTNPTSRDKNTAAGLGNLVADGMIKYSDADGSNSNGKYPFTKPDVAGYKFYQDYTNYSPCNAPLLTTINTTTEHCNKINIDKWEPLTTPSSIDGTGSQTQVYYSPHMPQVKGFALECSSQLRPRGPPVYGMNANGRMSFEDQHNQILDVSSTLNDREKMITEFWLPTEEFGNPANHNIFFAINALITENRSLGDCIKLFMALGNSQLDAGIGAWDAKRFYDSSRPITAIRCMHTGKQVKAWAGPYQGVKTMDAGKWLPYQTIDFVSPPFSEYVSGHSTFAMSGAVILEKFFGANWVGPNSVTINPGESLIEPKIMNNEDPLYEPGVTDKPNEGPYSVGYSPAAPVILSWQTWRDGAEESGVSRIYAGVHIKDGNEDGLALGDAIGELVWDKCTALFEGEKYTPHYEPDTPLEDGIPKEIYHEASVLPDLDSEPETSSASSVAFSFSLLLVFFAM